MSGRKKSPRTFDISSPSILSSFHSPQRKLERRIWSHLSSRKNRRSPSSSFFLLLSQNIIHCFSIPIIQRLRKIHSGVVNEGRNEKSEFPEGERGRYIFGPEPKAISLLCSKSIRSR